MKIRESVQAVIDGIQRGEVLETFEEFYDDAIVMSENGEAERVGKAVNREYEKAFVEGVEFHGASVGRVLVDGDHASIEWTFDITPKGGERVVQRQVAVQTGRDGRVVREDFYHG